MKIFGWPERSGKVEQNSKNTWNLKQSSLQLGRKVKDKSFSSQSILFHYFLSFTIDQICYTFRWQTREFKDSVFLFYVSWPHVRRSSHSSSFLRHLNNAVTTAFQSHSLAYFLRKQSRTQIHSMLLLSHKDSVTARIYTYDTDTRDRYRLTIISCTRIVTNKKYIQNRDSKMHLTDIWIWLLSGTHCCIFSGMKFLL